VLQVVKNPELAYLLVAQGGGSLTGSIVRTTLFSVGTSMMEEALNGYSIVFSGAMLKADLAKIGDRKYTFVKVDSLDALLQDKSHAG